VHPPSEALEELVCLLQEERAKLTAALYARHTVTGYGYDWQRFERWCVTVGLTALPADTETLEIYVTARLRDGRKANTVRRDVSAIASKHVGAGLPSPATTEVWELIDSARRQRGERLRQMQPLCVDDLRAMANAFLARGDKRSTRNRALLLLGFASALRGQTLVDLRMDDLEFVPRGVVISIRREKQDQAAKGREIGIPFGKNTTTCPVNALRDWLCVRGDGPGLVFGLTTYEAVRLIVKAAVRGIGLDPVRYGSHSLRAGFVTASGEAGAGELVIAAHTGHKTMAVLRRYFRRSDLFRANPCAALDL
jgi:integrase